MSDLQIPQNIRPISETLCMDKLVYCEQRLANWSAQTINEVYAKTGAQFKYLILAMALYATSIIILRWLKKLGWVTESRYMEWLEGFVLGLVIISFIFLGMVVMT